MPKKKSEKPESSLDGWTRVIQDQGRERAQEEALRKGVASKLIKEARQLEPLERAKVLVEALDQRVLNLNEFLVEIRAAVGLEPLE